MRRLFPLALVATVAMACSSPGPTLVATDDPSTPTAAPADTSDNDGGAGQTDGVAVEAADPSPTATEDAPGPAPGTDETDGDAADDGDSDADASGDTDDDPPDANPGCSAPRAGTTTEELTIDADVDLDGEPDRVITYAIDGDGPQTWRLRVETAAGESLDGPLAVDRALVGVVEPLGGVDIDGDDSAEELLTVVGAGASTRLIAIHVRDGCELVQAGLDDFPITFPVGGSIGNTAGLECIDADDDGTIDSFVAWVGVANFDTDAGDYFIDGVEYQLRSGALEQIGNRTLEANIREADFVYGQLACADVNG